ncbi:hypothetical protein RSOLAG22IIIB_10091 [Rhizoctonia solani]|uniref:Uncharacterized protein n=1 Tax=Rhizoctonia solani TaxID=456999 RepID=A0A0K6G0Q1_9AGAM|nr:hypothetical protein RSOLAG22IIIB_10091 [Rhizoctonia solani]
MPGHGPPTVDKELLNDLNHQAYHGHNIIPSKGPTGCSVCDPGFLKASHEIARKMKRELVNVKREEDEMCQ